MILILDNYDSFTYNLAQYVQELGAEVVVRRNDDITVEEIEAMAPEGILISPGPCTPDKAGISEEVIQRLGGRIPIFGVCLGMQAIGEVYGGKIVRAKQIMHGKDSEIRHEGKGVFQGLPSRFRAIRYHSLVIEPSSVPSELEVTATSEDGEIMGVRHRGVDVEGVQFHPESALSESGKELVANWVRRVTSR
ncbi:MAG: aminodeoxychorismate/anthranilate synthase component II [Armatimonadetes bacterium]|nr:aminodeoxychorismate/anthranilate synthase component II [Armatimonadota bacterium]NOG93656.1 aminodeoxychorismate/anthranilate synthase component II [Armatimonadota bacterium]